MLVLLKASANAPIYQHATENTDNIFSVEDNVYVVVDEKPAAANDKEDFAYIMVIDGEELSTEPFIASMAENDIIAWPQIC